ncbi:hypothetical protein VP01_6133g1, partial [Puccinia sorghi]
TPWIKFPTLRQLLKEANPHQLSKLYFPPTPISLRGMKFKPFLPLEMRIQPSFSSSSFRPSNNLAVPAFFCLVIFFCQMIPLCSQMIARRSSTQPRTWAVEPPNCSNHIWTSSKANLPSVSSTIVQNVEFKLNSLSMKENGKASTYITQFQTLQSRIDWNNTTFALHFQKRLWSHITNQLALTGQRPTKPHQPRRMKMLRSTRRSFCQNPPLENLCFKPFTGEILSLNHSMCFPLLLLLIIFQTSSSFKRNFELTLKQPVNATSNKPINFTSNLPLSTLTNSKDFREEVWSIQNQISCFEKCLQTLSSFKIVSLLLYRDKQP